MIILLNAIYRRSAYLSISYFIAYVTKYIVGTTIPEEEIKHLTKETKIILLPIRFELYF